MPRKPDTPCASCGKLLYGGKGALPAGQRTCVDCRGIVRASASAIGNKGQCAEPGCPKPLRKRGLCSTHYNKATGHYFVAAEKDPERERARLRIKTYRRKDWARLTDITPEYEMALRTTAKRCPLCAVKLVNEPYLPNSKELDHIVPKGAGGTHTIGNVRIICRACNIARPKDGSDYTGPVTLWAEVA
jgi:5-methylcytosine-specific restriction endonuclease McrA